MNGSNGGRYDIATYVTLCKVLVTVVTVAWWAWLPEVGFRPGGTIWEHLLWPLSHANVWHLAGNLWVLWWLKGRLHLREAYVMAVVCSFLPVVPGVWDIAGGEAAATCGFSGVLCAVIGVKWGAWCGGCHEGCHGMTAYGTFCRRVLPFVAAGALIPHVNWSIHLYCLLAGLLYGRLAVIRQHTGHG